MMATHIVKCVNFPITISANHKFHIPQSATVSLLPLTADNHGSAIQRYVKSEKWKPIEVHKLLNQP